MNVKWKGLVKQLFFRGGWRRILHPVNIVNYYISDTFSPAPEAHVVVQWSWETCRLRAGVQRPVDKKTD
jgi:hypothetical protein